MTQPIRHSATAACRRAAGFLLLLVGACGESKGNRVSAPFQYSGYSSPEWGGHQRTSEFITLSDGTKIAVDVLVPTGYTGAGRPVERFPVIFQYTPYGRSAINLKTGEVPTPPNVAFFLSYGYAFVSADMRGTGGSDGWINLLDPKLRQDGKEIVDWIAAQPWSDGNVGMTGGAGGIVLAAGWRRHDEAVSRRRQPPSRRGTGNVRRRPVPGRFHAFVGMGAGRRKRSRASFGRT